MAFTKITDRQVTYKQGAIGSNVRNLGDKLKESVSVKDFGAVGDGITDDTAAIQTAFLIGGDVYVPEGNYLINSLGGTNSGVTVFSDKSISITCSPKAVFIAGPFLAGLNGNVMLFNSTVDPTNTTDTNFVTFSFVGSKFSGQVLTTNNGAGSGSGLSFLDISGYTSVKVDSVVFDAGVTTPSLNNVGCGYIDTGLGTHSNISETITNCLFRGVYDVGIYGNGVRSLVDLGVNPLTTGAAGTSIVTVAHTAHGLLTGDMVGIGLATVVDGVTVSDCLGLD